MSEQPAISHCELSADAERLIQGGCKLGGYFYHGNFIWTFGRPNSWTFYGTTPSEAIQDCVEFYKRKAEPHDRTQADSLG